MQPTTPRRTTARSALAALSCAIGATPAYAQVTYQVIARSGQPANGSPNNFDFFNPPVCRAPGVVAAYARTLVDLRSGIWAGSAGAFLKVGLEGETLPGTEPRVITTILTPAQSRHGVVAFKGIIDPFPGMSFNDEAIFSGAPGAVSILARENDIAPDTGGLRYDSSSSPLSINDSGAVGFKTRIRGAGVGATNDMAIFVGSTGSVALAMRLGDPVPGHPGETFTAMSFPGVLSSGDTVFAATFSGLNVSGWWKKPVGESLVPLVVSGDPAPGFPAGWSFNGVPNNVIPAVNDHGDMALACTAIFSPTASSGLWSGQPGSLVLRAHTGDPAPAPGAAPAFGTFGFTTINRDAVVLFFATLTQSIGANGLFTHTPGVGIRRIASLNETAPGAGGALFSSFGAPACSLNNRSEALFVALLGNGRTGVFAGRPGRLRKLILTGESVEVSPGVFRTVSALAVQTNAGPDAGQPSAINDRGEVAVSVTFTGGTSALFLYQLPHPCPGDATGDDTIDFIDLNVILGEYGASAPGLAGDLNGDGAVDFLDLNIVLGAFGLAC